MKQILSFLLFFLPALAFAQWPAAPNKIRLGNQTTGDGLIVRTDSIPNWTPATNRDAWVAFDTVAGVLYYYEGGTWNGFTGGGSTPDLEFTGSADVVQLSAGAAPVYFAEGANVQLTQSGDTLYIESTGGVGSITSFTLAGTSGTPQTITDGNTVTIAAGVGMTTTAEATDQVTVAADTATVLASKTWVNTRGFPTGEGVTNRFARWATSTILAETRMEQADTIRISVLGPTAFRLPNWTTAQRPASPLAGDVGYNTTNGALEYYGASAWEVPVKSATVDGLLTPGQVLFPDANGRATGNSNLFWDNTNSRLGIGTTTPRARLHVSLSGTNNSVITNVATFENGETTAANGGGLKISYRGMVRTTGSASVVDSMMTNYVTKAVTGSSTGLYAGWTLKGYDAGSTHHNVLTISNKISGHGVSAGTHVGVGINIDPQSITHALRVNGQIRCDTLTATAESLAGWTGTSAHGVATRVAIGSGLSLSAGTLSASGGTWLKPELEAGPVTINPGNNTLTFNTIGAVSYDPVLQFNHDAGQDDVYTTFFEAKDTTGTQYARFFQETERYYLSSNKGIYVGNSDTTSTHNLFSGQTKAQIYGGVNGHLEVTGGYGKGGKIRLKDSAFSDYAQITVPDDITTSYTITLPATGPSAAGQTLVTTSSSGTLAWNGVATRGTTTDTTDGSGDITISNTMPDATFVVTVTAVGTTPYILTVHTKTSSDFKVRVFDATGAAVTSTSVTIDWSATDN